MISNVEEAKSIWAQAKSYMMIMQLDFTCWIREGIVNEENILTANGMKIVQITDDVFDVRVGHK